ncbi:hypothetical protein P152DRAFT_445710 [Eremomyces bilateralis CBS 781.70]|uniref:Uncharacterized protein n=1 Tax=Eremomyces bilateralis CBS 781.70 TaxID=1392243 RepID=A0A6G1GI36_9PEZI|nr:uncharacterized protein P152DRAFT_445710 [Eremomyces bilateralis CBS 781.70]KAF1817664.1 hypothetical protein P152DRAFT_445710 [Eremomyces bilateralis CBS 781.70]
MSRQAIARHYARISSLWPTDPLRPQITFQSAIQFRESLASPQPAAESVQSSTPAAPLDGQRELRNANALYSLLDNRYMKKYPISKDVLKPKSNVTYYDDLIKELEMAPRRNWWENFVTNLRGKIRFS